MSASGRKPIPMSAAQRLKVFQTSFLPLLVFGAALFLVAALWRERIAAITAIGPTAEPTAWGTSYPGHPGCGARLLPLVVFVPPPGASARAPQ